MTAFTQDEVCDLTDAVKNLIQDKLDYCLGEEGVEEQIERLRALEAKLAAYAA